MSLFKVYFAIFKFVILSNLNQATCPPNSTPGTNNGKCYSFFDTPGDFNAAERGCTEVGGHLVSICNAFENNILADQPGNSSDCASFQISGGKWQGSDCNAPKAFVCETYSENQSVKPMCKNGYTYYGDWNTCYKYFATGLPWSDAEKSCVNDSGHLLSIHSNDEKIFIDALMLKQVGVYSDVWIGYNTDPQRLIYAQFWGWTDRTPNIYSLWHPDFPINASTCAVMVPVFMTNLMSYRSAPGNLRDSRYEI
uniref:C-type lectin domain-containing protein n=1 Tax=Acrobeloides nanus TaxID=290746 RepID=A0A914DNN6_9BILA